MAWLIEKDISFWPYLLFCSYLCLLYKSIINHTPLVQGDFTSQTFWVSCGPYISDMQAWGSIFHCSLCSVHMRRRPTSSPTLHTNILKRLHMLMYLDLLVGKRRESLKEWRRPNPSCTAPGSAPALTASE
jgi:hypothetical protein